MRETRPKAKSRIRKSEVSDAATLSVRLTSEERKLLADAAALRGWTPTNLLRVAALERAAQILNMSRPIKLDFARQAAAIAATLCEPRKAYEETPDNPENAPQLETDWITPPPLSAPEIQSLREAVRLGGPEFLSLVLAECARLVAGDVPPKELPDPIDPDSFL